MVQVRAPEVRIVLRNLPERLPLHARALVHFSSNLVHPLPLAPHAAAAAPHAADGEEGGMPQLGRGEQGVEEGRGCAHRPLGADCRRRRS